jgi:3-oxoacyl-[acyl-carrier-protein] synthase II
MDIVTEFVFSGFSALKALSPQPCRPFDRERSGLSLGEGAAALLLMSEERALREGREKLGAVLGGAVVNDANHITAPSRDGSGLAEAIAQALRAAGTGAGSMAAVCAHGTGTIHNDLMELKAFSRVFGGDRTPVFSVKGAIGHTLGAAGGIEAVISLRALREGSIPPTAGFVNPESGAEGLVSSRPVGIAGRHLLSTNSGFGGVNAAVVLEGASEG